MEKIIAKIKTNTIITFILGILSLTWLLIDYFVFREIVGRYQIEFSLEVMLILISAIAILIFHIAVAFTLYYNFRLQMRYKSEKRRFSSETHAPDREESEKKQIENRSEEDDSGKSNFPGGRI